MDFNMKKLASDAGVFFTRAVQVGRAGGQIGVRGLCKRGSRVFPRLIV